MLLEHNSCAGGDRITLDPSTDRAASSFAAALAVRTTLKKNAFTASASGKKRPCLAVRFAPPIEDATAAPRDRSDAIFAHMEDSGEALIDARSEADDFTDFEDTSSASTEEFDRGGVRATILGPGSPNLIDMSDPCERALIWYSSEEIGSFKSSARALASWIKKSEAQRSEDRNSCGGDGELLTLLRLYRERFDRRGGGAAEEGSAEIGEGLVRLGLVPLELSHLDPADVSEHRGLEFRVSFERQRNKFIALRAVVTYMARLHNEANKRGVELTEYPVGKIAYVSNKVTRWSRNLARKEGLDDFRAAYPHLVPQEEVDKQISLSLTGEASGAHEFPLKWKKRKNPSDSVSDDLSSMLSSDMSLSNTSHSEVMSLSSMRSNTSIQSSYIKVKPFFEAVAEEQEHELQQQQGQGQGQEQQDEPKRRRRRGPSFTKGVTKGVTKALLGKKLSL